MEGEQSSLGSSGNLTANKEPAAQSTPIAGEKKTHSGENESEEHSLDEHRSEIEDIIDEMLSLSAPPAPGKPCQCPITATQHELVYNNKLFFISDWNIVSTVDGESEARSNGDIIGSEVEPSTAEGVIAGQSQTNSETDSDSLLSLFAPNDLFGPTPPDAVNSQNIENEINGSEDTIIDSSSRTGNASNEQSQNEIADKKPEVFYDTEANMSINEDLFHSFSNNEEEFVTPKPAANISPTADGQGSSFGSAFNEPSCSTSHTLVPYCTEYRSKAAKSVKTSGIAAADGNEHHMANENEPIEISDTDDDDDSQDEQDSVQTISSTNSENSSGSTDSLYSQDSRGSRLTGVLKNFFNKMRKN